MIIALVSLKENNYPQNFKIKKKKSNTVFLLKIIELGLKWVHMARYELISKLDGAIWLAVISKPLLTPRRAMERPNILKESIKNKEDAPGCTDHFLIE